MAFFEPGSPSSSRSYQQTFRDDPVTLSHRHEMVSQLTRKYYRGDLWPPSTMSLILPAQKFAVLYYHCVNALFFLYAFFIPLHLSAPYYGGLDLRDFSLTPAHIVVIAVVLALPLIRFLILSWAAEFYNFALVLAGLEAACLLFVVLWWSRGLPVLLVLAISNMLNIAVTQLYWQGCFLRVVKELLALVPPSPGELCDQTTLDLWPGWGRVFSEIRWLWGFDLLRTEAALYDERCGVFGGKEQMSHVKAMYGAYTQALHPELGRVVWRHSPLELWSLNLAGLADGLLNTFISNAAYAFAGLWLGRAMFEDWFRGEYAVAIACIMVIIYFMSVARTTSLLSDGLGVAVAEKEWLAHDVVQHQGEREEMLFDVLDLDLNASGTNPTDPCVRDLACVDAMMRGRLNLTFMWLCVAATADFIGESYLAKMYWNLAVESRYMVEALTPYEFKLFPHAKWEVSVQSILIKAFQALALAMMLVLYFGTYFSPARLPVPLVATLGVACVVQSVAKVTEIMQFAFSILGAPVESVGVMHRVKRTTNRHAYVSESIMVVVLIFVLINVLFWLYLLPMMKQWDLPVGTCQWHFNRWLFPGACARRHDGSRLAK